MEKIKLIAVLIIATQICFAQSNKLDIKGQTIWLKNSQTEGIAENQRFNFNSIFISEKEKLEFKNILNNKYSLFVVFHYDLQTEKNIVTLNSNVTNLTISNKKIQNGSDLNYKKITAENGIILTYLSSSDLKIKKPNNLSFENFNNSNNLLEFMYFARVLSDLEKNKVESYLSIKYGISLLGTVDYINSNKTKIWDISKNGNYNKRVTGIGRDDKMSLNQLKSGNAEKEGLYIGIENNTKDIIQDRTSILWGDNGLKTTFLETPNNEMKKMERIWKVQVNSENDKPEIKTQIQIKKSEFGYKNEKKRFQLVIYKNDDPEFKDANAIFYKPSSENTESIFFNDVVWDNDKSGSDMFSFVELLELTTISKPMKEKNIKNNFEEKWVLSPNPSKTGEEFSIQFKLNEPKAVTISIVDMNGKLIKFKNIGLIRNYNFTESIETSGVYLIKINIDESIETAKLIIK